MSTLISTVLKSKSPRPQTSSHQPQSSMQRQFQDKLTRFIEQELNVEPRAIALALRDVQFPFQIPVSLWQYGLISLDQVSQIWTWVESMSGDNSVTGDCL